MKIGTMLYLDQGEDRYRSRLVEEREGQWFIDLPIHMKTNRTTFMQEGTLLDISFIAEDMALYTFKTRIKGKELGRVPMLVLDQPEKENLSRHQRREFVRIEGSVDIAIHPKEERFLAFTTTTVDLSGGGLAIRLPRFHGLKENMEVHSYLVLPQQSGSFHYLFLTCKVVRIFKLKNDQGETASLEFGSIREKERQYIMRYCFEEQLIRKRKGLKL